MYTQDEFQEIMWNEKKARWENSLVGEPRSHKLTGRQAREKERHRRVHRV